MDTGGINYEALIAWLTLAAVVVALMLGLIPWFKQEREKKKNQRYLTVQLIRILFPIGSRLQYHLKNHKNERYRFSKEDTKLYNELKILFPQLIILQKELLQPLNAFFVEFSLFHDRRQKDMPYKAVKLLNEVLTAVLERLNKEMAMLLQSYMLATEDIDRIVKGPMS